MARGPSGRIIIEIDPAFKRDLHSALAADGLSLKNWFLKQGAEYLVERKQPGLPGINYTAITNDPIALVAEEPAKYKISSLREPKSLNED